MTTTVRISLPARGSSSSSEEPTSSRACRAVGPPQRGSDLRAKRRRARPSVRNRARAPRGSTDLGHVRIDRQLGVTSASTSASSRRRRRPRSGAGSPCRVCPRRAGSPASARRWPRSAGRKAPEARCEVGHLGPAPQVTKRNRERGRRYEQALQPCGRPSSPRLRRDEREEQRHVRRMPIDVRSALVRSRHRSTIGEGGFRDGDHDGGHPSTNLPK